MCDLLTTGEVKIVLIVLDALESAFKTLGPACWPEIVRLIEEAGGVDTLENLQEHADQQVWGMGWCN